MTATPTPAPHNRFRIRLSQLKTAPCPALRRGAGHSSPLVTSDDGRWKVSTYMCVYSSVAGAKDPCPEHPEDTRLVQLINGLMD